jgi:hypothetical protein
MLCLEAKSFGEDTLKTHYQERKAIEVASRLLVNEGKRMNYTKLIKLMYIIERESIIRWGYPVTFDDYYSLDCGPILSNTLDNIKGTTYSEHPSKEWDIHITRYGKYSVRLKLEANPKKLNRAELKLIDEMYGKFGHMTWQQLIDWSHDKNNINEWENPEGGRLPIDIRTIMKEGGFSKEDIDEIFEDIEVSQSIRELLVA